MLDTATEEVVVINFPDIQDEALQRNGRREGEVRKISAWLFIAGLLTAAAAAARAEDLIFLSTQLRPIEEAQKEHQQHIDAPDRRAEAIDKN